MDTLARPDSIALVAHLVGAALFSGVFLFLYRESRIIYFGYWATAWALLSAAQLSNLTALLTGQMALLYPYALLELAFTASIFFAAASVFGKFDPGLSWPAALIPILLILGYALGLFSGLSGFYAMASLLLAAAYGWNFVAFHRRWKSVRGGGRKLFSGALVASSLVHAHYAVLYISARLSHAAPAIPPHLRYEDLFDLFLETVLAFSAMMMWMETQNEQLADLNAQLERSRSEIASNARIDGLTGLLNQAALKEFCELGDLVSGTVVVIDLDNFKDVNDVLGHTSGNEVLANVGDLIKKSVRKEDEAWRWGGDEFVLLFRDQSRDSVDKRMLGFQDRLKRFRIRRKGALPIQLSWGAVEVHERPLREAIEEADQQMYLRKRDKAAVVKFFGKS